MRRFIGAALFLILMAGPAFAQAGFGGLAGTVTDKTQAAVVSATVTLTGSNGEDRSMKTNGHGEYLFTALPVGGGYTIAVSAAGFETARVTGLSTTVGAVLTQNVELAVGAQSTTIQVTAASVEQVQLESSAVSQLIDNTVFQDSPLDIRTQNTFVYLVAGAAGEYGSPTNRGAAMNGARTGTGDFLVEGMDNNDQGQGGRGFTYGTAGAVASISPDAIQEYRVITHDPPAEYGRAGGFATDTVLKSGTNRFHGSLFEYNRIQALAAENWFSNYYGLRDHLVRNQFGGSVGGPIYRDKTFFYATVEIQRVRTAEPVTGTVTTQAFLNFVNSGAFETFQETNAKGLCVLAIGTTCPGAFSDSHTLGPVFKGLLAAEPEAFPLGTQNATETAAGLYTGGFGVTYPVPIYATTGASQSAPTNQERASLKIDHKLTGKDQLGFAYILDFVNSSVAFGGGGTTFGPNETNIGGAQVFTGNWTHTFSPSMQNLFRLGYTRHVSNFSSPGTQGVPMIYTTDPLYEGFGADSTYPQLFTENEFLYEDSLTKDVGKHELTTGFRYIRTRNGSSFYNDYYGTVLPYDTESLVTDDTFDDQADRVVYGTPTYGSLYEASAAIDTTTNQAPDPYRGFRANEFAAYAQDDWKATGKLTLNLGVRWEYFGPPHNSQPGYDSNVFFGPFVTPTPNGNPFLPNSTFIGAMQGASFQSVPNAQHSALWNKDTNNFAPRLGFSYDPTGTGKMAVRGGFGIGYDRLYNNAYENIRFNSPRYADNSIGAYINGVAAGALEQPALVNIPFTANDLFAAYGGKPVPRHMDQRMVTAYYEQADLGIEKEIARGYIAEVNYIGTFGRKLVGLKDANNFDGRTACPTLTAACRAAGFTAATTARPNTAFNEDDFRTNGFTSNYNGLQLSLRKGYSNGLMFLANYTYSKTLDEISDIFDVKNYSQSGITDPTNPGYDYGPADFDTRHMATITINYESQWRKKNLLLGGWGISPIVTLQSGTPFSIVDSSSNYNPNKDGRPGIDRAVYTGRGFYNGAIGHNARPSGPGYLNISQFAAYTCPDNVNMGLWCDPPMARNAFYGPGVMNMDVALSKRFYVHRDKQVIVQAAFFNAFNHPNFANPVSDINNASQFGFAQYTNTLSRQTQLSLRYDF